MRHPTISGGRVWENHRRRVLRIFELALKLLQDEEELDACENSLNRRLFFCVRKANAELYELKESIEWEVTYEGRNPPDVDDEFKAPREDKIPDFQWGVIDWTESNPARQAKNFVIECKKLGKPRSKSWVYNKNYVQNGILRFVKKRHGYGKSAPSGAMVGYIRDMETDHALSEVNQHAENAGLNKIHLSDGGWIEGGASRLDQVLDRQEVLPTPFSLHHLWVDLSARKS